MRPVCLLMVFLPTLYTTFPHTLIQDKLMILLKELSREKSLLTLHVMTEMYVLLQKNLKNIMHGHVKMYDALTFFWTTFLFNLAPSCIEK